MPLTTVTSARPSHRRLSIRHLLINSIFLHCSGSSAFCRAAVCYCTRAREAASRARRGHDGAAAEAAERAVSSPRMRTGEAQPSVSARRVTRTCVRRAPAAGMRVSGRKWYEQAARYILQHTTYDAIPPVCLRVTAFTSYTHTLYL